MKGFFALAFVGIVAVLIVVLIVAGFRNYYPAPWDDDEED